MSLSHLQDIKNLGYKTQIPSLEPRTLQDEPGPFTSQTSNICSAWSLACYVILPHLYGLPPWFLSLTHLPVPECQVNSYPAFKTTQASLPPWNPPWSLHIPKSKLLLCNHKWLLLADCILVTFHKRIFLFWASCLLRTSCIEPKA